MYSSRYTVLETRVACHDHSCAPPLPSCLQLGSSLAIIKTPAQRKTVRYMATAANQVLIGATEVGFPEGMSSPPSLGACHPPFPEVMSSLLP